MRFRLTLSLSLSLALYISLSYMNTHALTRTFCVSVFRYSSIREAASPKIQPRTIFFCFESFGFHLHDDGDPRPALPKPGPGWGRAEAGTGAGPKSRRNENKNLTERMKTDCDEKVSPSDKKNQSVSQSSALKQNQDWPGWAKVVDLKSDEQVVVGSIPASINSSLSRKWLSPLFGILIILWKIIVWGNAVSGTRGRNMNYDLTKLSLIASGFRILLSSVECYILVESESAT